MKIAECDVNNYKNNLSDDYTNEKFKYNHLMNENYLNLYKNMLMNLDTSFYLNNIFNQSIKPNTVEKDISKFNMENHGNDYIKSKNLNNISHNESKIEQKIKDTRNPSAFKDNLCKSLIEKLIKQHTNNEHRLSMKNGFKMRHLINEKNGIYEKYTKYARQRALKKILKNKSIELPLFSSNDILLNNDINPSLKSKSNVTNLNTKIQNDKPTFNQSNVIKVDYNNKTSKQSNLLNGQLSNINSNLEFYKKYLDLNNQFKRNLTNNMMLPVNFSQNNSSSFFTSSNQFKINSFI